MKYLKDYKLFKESLSISDKAIYIDTILSREVSNWDINSLENDNFDNIIKILQNDCKIYLDLLSKNSKLLFKGTNHVEDFIDDGIYLKNVRKDRKPKDTSNDINKHISELFINKFNESVREIGTFVTKNPGVAKDYGNPYIFIPIGEFNYYHNPKVDDLYTYINETPWYIYKSSNDKKFEYDNIYGEGTQNGEYYFDNKPYGIYEYDAIAEVEEDYDYYTQKEIKAMLEWKPNLSFEQYSNLMEKQYTQEINNLVDEYVKNAPYDTISTQEITIICDKYYLIEKEYYNKLIEYIKNK